MNPDILSALRQNLMPDPQGDSPNPLASAFARYGQPQLPMVPGGDYPNANSPNFLSSLMGAPSDGQANDPQQVIGDFHSAAAKAMKSHQDLQNKMAALQMLIKNQPNQTPPGLGKGEALIKALILAAARMSGHANMQSLQGASQAYDEARLSPAREKMQNDLRKWGQDVQGAQLGIQGAQENQQFDQGQQLLANQRELTNKKTDVQLYLAAQAAAAKVAKENQTQDGKVIAPLVQSLLKGEGSESDRAGAKATLVAMYYKDPAAHPELNPAIIDQWDQQGYKVGIAQQRADAYASRVDKLNDWTTTQIGSKETLTPLQAAVYKAHAAQIVAKTELLPKEFQDKVARGWAKLSIEKIKANKSGGNQKATGAARNDLLKNYTEAAKILQMQYRGLQSQSVLNPNDKSIQSQMDEKMRQLDTIREHLTTPSDLIQTPEAARAAVDSAFPPQSANQQALDEVWKQANPGMHPPARIEGDIGVQFNSSMDRNTANTSNSSKPLSGGKPTGKPKGKTGKTKSGIPFTYNP